MPQFRKKPVVVEALQFTGGNFMEIAAFAAPDAMRAYGKNMQIKTLEGVAIASEGDWVIKGVRGEFYSCKPEIFAATYEPA